MKKKIVIAGGTGFLGEGLIHSLKSQFDITVLTRRPSQSINGVHYVHWDAATLTGWEKQLEDCEALINLTGKSVNCRYNKRNKEEITSSRINSTRILNEAILQCKTPLKHFINSSTATIYVDSRTKKNTEYNGEIGNDFSMMVTKKWEAVFFETPTPNTLKTAIRTGFVLGKNGGALPTLKKITQLGFGGKQGDGEQMVSWLHEEDFVRAITFILTEKLIGVINLVSPNPVSNAAFMQQLRTTLRVKFGLPTPTPLLKAGAFVIGTEPELILKSRNVHPQILLDHLFVFKYPLIKAALLSIYS